MNVNQWIMERYQKGTLTEYLTRCYLSTAGYTAKQIENIFKYSYVQDSMGLKCHATKKDATLFAFTHRKAARFAFQSRHKKPHYVIYLPDIILPEW